MDERAQAIELANRILDRPSGDSDDDLAVLSRQLLRLREIVQAVAADAVLDRDDNQTYLVDFIPIINAQTYIKVTASSANPQSSTGE